MELAPAKEAVVHEKNRVSLVLRAIPEIHDAPIVGSVAGQGVSTSAEWEEDEPRTASVGDYVVCSAAGGQLAAGRDLTPAYRVRSTSIRLSAIIH